MPRILCFTIEQILDNPQVSSFSLSALLVRIHLRSLNDALSPPTRTDLPGPENLPDCGRGVESEPALTRGHGLGQLLGS